MSTRMMVTECFDGKHVECRGYNGPADNPNFRCDCDCHRTPTTTEPGVEDCLRELREMFPGSRCQLTDTTIVRGGFGVMEFDYQPKLYEHANGRIVEIWLMDVRPSNSELGIKMRGPTLSEAMAQVRQWHESQRLEGKL